MPYSYMYDRCAVARKNNIPWAERNRLADRVLAENHGGNPGPQGQPAIPCYFCKLKFGRVFRTGTAKGAVSRWVSFPGDLEITVLDPDKPLVAENLVLACRSCSRRRSKPTYGPPGRGPDLTR